jgi:phenylpropionate dioxygenase-like ring-hydroxylating dioxygenase large terminal subunit
MDATPIVLLDNDDPRLRRAWHAVARSVDVGDAAHVVKLNGDSYTLVRRGNTVRSGHGHENESHSPVEIQDGEAWGIQELYDLVWIAQEEPVQPLPNIPEWFDPTYHSAVLTKKTPVSAGVLIDNFLDVTHFSYLHRQSFGRSRPVTDDGYSIEVNGEEVKLTHDTVLQEAQRNSVGGLGQQRIATYTYWPPYMTHLQMFFPEDGTVAAATLITQPEAADSTNAYVLVLIPLSDPGLDEQVTFSERVLMEDLRILERMADPRLCLSFRSELHTRADRASVEMRKSIAKFIGRCEAKESVELTEGAMA